MASPKEIKFSPESPHASMVMFSMESPLMFENASSRPDAQETVTSDLLALPMSAMFWRSYTGLNCSTQWHPASRRSVVSDEILPSASSSAVFCISVALAFDAPHCTWVQFFAAGCTITSLPLQHRRTQQRVASRQPNTVPLMPSALRVNKIWCCINAENIIYGTFYTRPAEHVQTYSACRSIPVSHYQL